LDPLVNATLDPDVTLVGEARGDLGIVLIRRLGLAQRARVDVRKRVLGRRLAWRPIPDVPEAPPQLAVVDAKCHAVAAVYRDG
jgi:hypothetical protein